MHEHERNANFFRADHILKILHFYVTYEVHFLQRTFENMVHGAPSSVESGRSHVISNDARFTARLNRLTRVYIIMVG